VKNIFKLVFKSLKKYCGDILKKFKTMKLFNLRKKFYTKIVSVAFDEKNK
jgi:hypothetical protein